MSIVIKTSTKPRRKRVIMQWWIGDHGCGGAVKEGMITC